jgi:hypothetical protein
VTVLTWDFVAVTIFVAYCQVSLQLHYGLHLAWLEWAWLALKWPALASIFFMWFQVISNPFSGLLLALDLYVWWTLRNSGDDDFRRKQKRRVAAKVKAVAGRLVVVPT